MKSWREPFAHVSPDAAPLPWVMGFPGWGGNSLKGELSFAMLFCCRREDSWVDPEIVNPDRFGRVKLSFAHSALGPMARWRLKDAEGVLAFKQ